MKKNTQTDPMVLRLQNNLTLIRKLVGWSMEELGDNIGVRKQTISNLENKKSEMTVTQYIAIRAVLDREIEERTEKDKDDILGKAIDLLLNSEIDEEDEKMLREKLSEIADEVAGGFKSLTKTTTFKAMLGAGIGGFIGGIPGAVYGGAVAVKGKDWLKAIMDKKNKEN